MRRVRRRSCSWRENPVQPDPATCRPTRPMPVIAFAGDKDTTNPIEGGGEGYWQYSMRAAEDRWAETLPMRSSAKDALGGRGVYEERHSDCRAGADVIGVITVGAGHDWVADNEAMWAFLSGYRLAP